MHHKKIAYFKPQIENTRKFLPHPFIFKIPVARKIMKVFLKENRKLLQYEIPTMVASKTSICLQVFVWDIDFIWQMSE